MRPHNGNGLSGFHHVAHINQVLRIIGIHRFQSVLVSHHNHVTIFEMLAREAHRASKHCLYGIALCRGNLQSVVGLSYGLAYGQRKRIFVGAQVAQFYIKRV